MASKFLILLQAVALIATGSAVGRSWPGTCPEHRLPCAVSQLPPTSVTWTNLLNCRVLNGVLQKTSGCDGCADASATSSQAIVSGDGYLQITADNATTDRYCGLSHQGHSPNYPSLDFAFHLSEKGYLEVREDNVY